MSVFYSDEDNSDVEREKKQRRNLISIREAAAHDVPSTSERPEPNMMEELSEEAELSKLRNNERYQRYVATRKTEGLETTGIAKRPRSPAVHLGEYDARVSKDKSALAMAKTVISGEAAHKLSNTSSEKAQQGKREVSGAEPPFAASRPPRKGPAIDPKIIDDSSDDDSASDSSSESPIGPILPEDAQQRELGKLLNGLPIQNEASLGALHGSHVSAITIERAGNRLVTASIDSTVKLWDFNVMNRSLQPFKTVCPFDEGPVHSLKFSPTSAQMVCTGTGNSAVIMDRDGYVLSETGKGDVYIVDMARTTGHAGRVLSAKWRPGEDGGAKMIATTSADATIRLWDVNRTSKKPMYANPIISQVRVTKLRTDRGGKSVATAMDWTPDAKSCVVACSDGKVKIVDPAAFSMRPIDESSKCVQDGAEATSITVAPSSSSVPLILVRSTDDFLRVFDRRRLKFPLKEFEDLSNVVSETNACFLGDSGEFFMTGTSASRKSSTSRGSIRMFHAATLREVWKSCTDDDTGSVVCMEWHPTLNQIIYGSADGRVRVLYHPTESRKGVLNCLGKSDFRKTQGAVSIGIGEVYAASDFYQKRSRGGVTPSGGADGALSKRRRREASVAMKPKPFSGPRICQQKGSSKSLAKYLAADEISKEWSNDPREAILRYAEIAEKDPKFTRAYHATQPKTLLTEKTAEQEEEETREAIYARDLLRKRKG